jgi:uncharacterized membrane protein YfcA
VDLFTIYLPIAGVDFNVLILLLIGFTVGVCGGFFGIGGAWIATPALNIFGLPMPYAIGTDLAHVGGKSIVSTMRHRRFGHVDVRLGASMILGTTVGMELGANFVLMLERAGLAESVIRKAYVVLLAFTGCLVLVDYLIHRRRERRVAAGGADLPPRLLLAHRLHQIRIPPMIDFGVSGIRCSLWLPMLVGLTTGIVASVFGVGGGFIRMPALLYLLGCPTAVAIGTDLFEVMITGAYGAFTFGVKGRVELLAAMWMLVGAAVGAQLGTVAVKYVRGYSIRLLFGITIFVAAASVALKQLGFQLASSIAILTAGIGISSVIIGHLVKGVIAERAARLGPPPTGTGPDASPPA